jgi:hypothetical protein
MSIETHVSSLDEKPLAGYRGVSLTAVIALVLGIASILALVHPLLWVVPPVAVVVALIAIRAIDAPDSNLTGRNLALVGLAIALVFGLWAPSRAITRQAKLFGQARVFADEWFELVRAGKLHEAHQLTLAPIERQKPGVSLEAAYGASAELEKMNKDFWKDTPLMREISSLKDQARYEYAGGEGISPKEFVTEHIALNYVMHYTEGGNEFSIPIRIALDRSATMENHRYTWRVRGVVDPNRVTQP